MTGAQVTSAEVVRAFVDGRWSVGGEVVLDNIRFAARQHPDRIRLGGNGGVPLILRNFVPASLMRQGRYILMPQNAWPWRGPWGAPDEVLRRSLLRLVSEAAMRRGLGNLRISSAIPARGRVCLDPLHNVLDEGFEEALEKSRELTTGTPGHIVSVGRMDSYRNLPRLVRGFAKYRRRGGRLNLEIYGPLFSRMHYRRLRDASSSVAGVRIHEGTLGRADVVALFAHAHLVVFPSLVEASPIALLEAFCVATRLAASNIVGHVELAAGRLPHDNFFDALDEDGIADMLLAAENWPARNPPADLADERQRHQRRVEWANGLVQRLDEIFDADGKARAVVS